MQRSFSSAVSEGNMHTNIVVHVHTQIQFPRSLVFELRPDLLPESRVRTREFGVEYLQS